MRLPKFSTAIRKLPCQLTCLVVCFFILFSLIHVFWSAKVAAREIACRHNMRGLATALLQYSQDWDETLPPANHWADAAALHISSSDMPEVFHCPSARSPYSYVFNVHLDKLRLEAIE